MNLGYACINLSLSKNKPRITTNRGMIKKTFLEKGPKYAGELALLNSKDLLKILEWNVKNGISFFRISSDVFPWGSHYNIKELPQFNEIKSVLSKCGEYAQKNSLRLTAHPGPFNVLVSPNKDVVNRTIADLKVHADFFDIMGLTQTVYNKINIHCNGVYGDKIAAMDRFCENFKKLPDSVKKRLTIENDDKSSMYSVKDLIYIHEKINIPIVFDYHHHKFCPGNLSEKEALDLAISTWPNNIKPVAHYSESKSEHEGNSQIKAQAHSDYIKKLPKTYNHDLDIMIEAKAKDLAILPFIK